MMILTQAEAKVALRRAIEESGMSQARYAARVLIRGPRTVRRWLNDPGAEIPQAVIEHLERTLREQ
jgi:hypothetical protein